jgi:hypothetical protein
MKTSMINDYKVDYFLIYNFVSKYVKYFSYIYIQI